MAQLERKKFTQFLKDIDLQSLSGNLDSVISDLENLKQIYCTYENLQIEFEHFYEEVSCKLYGDREETDAEYNLRLQKFVKLQADKQKRADAKLQKSKLEQLKVNAKNKELEDLMKKFNVKTLDELRNIKNYINNIVI